MDDFIYLLEFRPWEQMVLVDGVSLKPSLELAQRYLP
jgi:hypothetical protein